MHNKRAVQSLSICPGLTTFKNKMCIKGKFVANKIKSPA